MTDNAIPAPAATDKTLKDLKGIRFKLSPSLDPRLVWFSSTFNSIYEDTTTDEETDTLFADAAIRTVMVADPISVLKRLFATSFVPSATETDPDRTTRITSLIQACTLSYDGRRTPELLRRAYQVESAMIESLSYTNRGVPDELVIHISGLYPTTFEFSDLRDFDNISTSLPINAPFVDPAASTNETFISTLAAIKDSISAMSIALTAGNTEHGDLADAEQAADGAPALPRVRRPYTSSIPTTYTELELLPMAQLPKEVRERIARKDEHHLVRNKSEFKPFKNELTTDYTCEPNEVLPWNFVMFPLSSQKWYISKSGSVFNVRDQTSSLRKSFLKTPTLKDPSAAGWYNWCQLFEGHCALSRVWVLPYEDHRPCDSSRGFVVGDPFSDPNTDFPESQAMLLNSWTQQIFDALSGDDIFPKVALYQDALATNPGDGYAILREIHNKLHPDLVSVPPNYVSQIPRQRLSETYLSFVIRYRFFQQMRGYMNDQASMFDSKVEQDCFINNLLHGSRIQTLIRDERTSTNETVKLRYTRGEFIRTIGNVLEHITADAKPARYGTPSTAPSASSSYQRPSNGDSRRSSRRYSDTRRSNSSSNSSTSASSRIHRLHALQIADDSLYNYDIDLRNIHSIMDHIQVPDGDSVHHDDHGLLMFDAALMSLDRDISKFDSRTQPCAICGQIGHAFSGCPALNNFDTVKGHYIKLCNAVNNLKRLSDRLNKPMSETKQIPVQQLEFQVYSLSQSPASLPASLPVNSLSHLPPSSAAPGYTPLPLHATYGLPRMSFPAAPAPPAIPTYHLSSHHTEHDTDSSGHHTDGSLAGLDTQNFQGPGHR